jgi:hypothetical protein
MSRLRLQMILLQLGQGRLTTHYQVLVVACRGTYASIDCPRQHSRIYLAPRLALIVLTQR